MRGGDKCISRAQENRWLALLWLEYLRLIWAGKAALDWRHNWVMVPVIGWHFGMLWELLKNEPPAVAGGWLGYTHTSVFTFIVGTGREAIVYPHIPIGWSCSKCLNNRHHHRLLLSNAWCSIAISAKAIFDIC